MILRRKLLIVAIILASILFVSLNMAFNDSSDDTSIFEDKENVSIAVTGDVMFARNMPNVLSLDSSPFSGVSDVNSQQLLAKQVSQRPQYSAHHHSTDKAQVKDLFDPLVLVCTGVLSHKVDGCLLEGV